MRPPLLSRAITGLLILSTVSAVGCEKRVIPARGDTPGPEKLLEGGELVFHDEFERGALGPSWKSEHAGWTISEGWVHSTDPRNEGLWLQTLLPQGPVRVEFTARSEPLPDGSFPGDLKCEIFGTEPLHQSGYILINGGWNNQLDVIARLDEHGKDRLAQAARPVQPSVAYRWAIVRVDRTLHWFRDGQPIMSYTDEAPLTGRHFGFNNWETNAYFDDLKIYQLPAH